jgi:PAS domain S-box-containing protein
MTKARKPARQQTHETGVQKAAALREEIHRTRGILDAIGDGISILDRNFTILYENRMHRKLMGDHRGEHCYRAYQKRQRMCKGCPVALTFSDGGIHTVKREIQNDKGKLYFEVTASPLRDKQGNIIAGIEAVRDITAREGAEHALTRRERELKISKEKYRDLIENLDEVIYSADKKGIITYISPIVESITGYAPSEVIGRHFSDFLIDEDAVRGRKRYQKILEGNIGAREYRMLTKSGSMRWIRVSSRPMYEENRVVGLHGILSDITEMKKIEESRAESETRLQSIIDNLPFDFFLIDQSGRYVMQNVLSKQHWGDVKGKLPEEISPDKNTLALWQYNNRRAFEGETVKEEVSFSMLGTRRDYYNIISPIHYGDSIQSIIVMNIDIAKLKEAEASLRSSEEKFRSLAEKSPNMIFINHKGKVVYVNQRCEEVMGYTREDFYEDNFDFYSLIAPEYHPLISSALQKHMQGQEVPPYEYAILAKDGSRLEVIITTKLIAYENDKAILGIITDITERKKNEEALKRNKEEILKIKERLNFILDSSPIALYTAHTKEDFGRTYISRSIKKVLGYEPEDFISTPSFWIDNIHPDDRERVLKEVSQMLKRGFFVGRYRFRAADGIYRWMQEESSLIVAKDGSPHEIIGCWMDITAQKEAEEALLHREHELQLKSQNLEELNTALQVLLKKREEDKERTEEKISSNIRELVRPYLDKIKNGELNETQKTYVSIIESNLEEITSSFTLRLSSEHLRLTPTEIKVANLISQGKTSKEIAELINSSPKAISFHRGNIRRKLGLQHKKTDLHSYLRANFIAS